MERERESPVRLPDVAGRRVGLELEELVEVGVDVLDDVVDLQLLLLEGRRHAAEEEDEEGQGEPVAVPPHDVNGGAADDAGDVVEEDQLVTISFNQEVV